MYKILKKIPLYKTLLGLEFMYVVLKIYESESKQLHLNLEEPLYRTI